MVTFTPRTGRYRIIAQHGKLVFVHTYTRASARANSYTPRYSWSVSILTQPPPQTQAPNRPHFVQRPRGEKEARGVGADTGAVEGRQATLLTLWPPGVNVGWLAASKWGYGIVGG